MQPPAMRKQVPATLPRTGTLTMQPQSKPRATQTQTQTSRRTASAWLHGPAASASVEHLPDPEAEPSRPDAPRQPGDRGLRGDATAGASQPSTSGSGASG